MQSKQKKWKQVFGLILKDIKLRQIGHLSSNSFPKELLFFPILTNNEKNKFNLLGTIGIGFGIL